MVPFVSLKRKRDPIGELNNHKVKLCAHGGKQAKGIDYWNTYSPVFQANATRLMLILHQMSNLKFHHLDYVLAFPQEPTDTDVCLRI